MVEEDDDTVTAAAVDGVDGESESVTSGNVTLAVFFLSSCARCSVAIFLLAGMRLTAQAGQARGDQRGCTDCCLLSRAWVMTSKVYGASRCE